MRHAIVLLPLLLALGTTPAGAQRPTRTPAPTPVPAVPTVHSGERPAIGLSGGAGSVDELIDRFLAAVKVGDPDAMHALRLTKAEYVGIIVPGEVPKGQPPRATFAEVNDVFFGMMDSKSRYVADSLIQGFKGREFVSRRIDLSKGSREFAWYTAHGEVRITLIASDGQETVLRTGWIAEVDDRFKFIGFNWDD